MDDQPRTIDEWSNYRMVYTGTEYQVQIHWTSPNFWEVLSDRDAVRALIKRVESLKRC